MADPVLLRSLACAALELYAMTDPLDVPMASVVRRARSWAPSDLEDEHIDQELLWDEVSFEFLQRYCLGFIMNIDLAEDPHAAVAEGIHRHLEWTARRPAVARFAARRRPRLDVARLHRAETEFEREVWEWWVARVGDEGTPRPALLPTWLGPADAVCARWLEDPSRPKPTEHAGWLIDHAQRALLG
jgi:hypothetical protein